METDLNNVSLSPLHPAAAVHRSENALSSLTVKLQTFHLKNEEKRLVIIHGRGWLLG